MKERHISVLLTEAIDALNVKDHGTYVDATFGAGGHTREILKRMKGGRVFAFDQDPISFKNIDQDILNDSRFQMIPKNFMTLNESLDSFQVNHIDGILFDLGMSSMHIDQANRGFSYMQDGPLDMRMNPNQLLTADVVFNTYEHDDLLRIFRDYGDIKLPHKFANFVISRRPYHSTFDVVKMTDQWFKKTSGHSAKAVFQAVRIEVNQEIHVIKDALTQALERLNTQGRLVVISFHSLEDRIVKQFIKKHSETQTPKRLPITNETLLLKKITTKPLIPSQEEMNINSRSKSAKMRVAEKAN